MATTVQVRRRHVYKDYFEKRSGGYFGATAPSQSSSQKHWECARLTDLTTHDITYKFNTPFLAFPIGYSTVKVFRYEAHPANASWLIITNVLFSFVFNLNPLTTLMLHIEELESLSGVIIEFELTE